jgi:hypothetical protein
LAGWWLPWHRSSSRTPHNSCECLYIHATEPSPAGAATPSCWSTDRFVLNWFKSTRHHVQYDMHHAAANLLHQRRTRRATGRSQWDPVLATVMQTVAPGRDVSPHIPNYQSNPRWIPGARSRLSPIGDKDLTLKHVSEMSTHSG